MSSAVAALSSLSSVEYAPYSSLKPFTTTLVGILNLDTINYVEVYHQLTITPTEILKMKGKKMELALVHPGGIVSAKVKLEDGTTSVKGIDKGTRPFNNCISMQMTVPDASGQAEKYIDLKLFRGKIQTTGSLSKEHTLFAWQAMYDYLKEMTKIGLTSEQLQELHIADLKYEMVDITFSIDFKINRDMLKGASNQCRSRGFHVIWEPGVHANGVNVKFPVTPYDGVVTKKKKKGMPTCVTFIVFTSGKCIVSGPNPEDTERAYNAFRRMMLELRPLVEWKAKA